MTRILSIDAATKSGYAVGDMIPGQHIPAVGQFGSHKVKGKDGAFFDAYSQWLVDLFATVDPQVVVFERPRAINLQTAEKLLGIQALIRLRTHRHQAKPLQVNVTSMRKYFTGHGSMKRDAAKKAMLAACHSRGLDCGTDDDAADAIGHLFYATNQLYKEGWG